MPPPLTVFVPASRVVRWFENFAARHGPIRLAVSDGRLSATAEDGATGQAALPLGRAYDGVAEPAAFARAVPPETRWGLLLVRKGGFAVAALDGEALLGVKVGRRHVQGRTKAGGQSQQRFSRRRENQARQAYAAAADHAHRVLVAEAEVRALVCGGDRAAVEAVLADPRLRRLARLRAGPWLAVPDPNRGVLDQAVADAASAQITISEDS